MGATSSVIQLKHNLVKAFLSAPYDISQVGDGLNEAISQPTSVDQIEGGEMGIQEATESIDRKIKGANSQELPLDRALRFLEVTIEGELSSHQPEFVSETMGRVREVLTSSGLRCERIYEVGDASLIQKRTSEIQGSIGRDDRMAMRGSSRLPVENEDMQLPHHSVQTGGGTNANKHDLTAFACMAGKRGDITALKELSGRMDLKGRDAFGRNALYYACLCGHVEAVHFLVIHTFGTVKDVPREELWECRKNALSDDVRRYLDTGTLPPKHSPRGTRDSASQEERAKVSRAESRAEEADSLGFLQDERDNESEDRTPEDPEASIALLYDDGDDGGDY